MLENNKDVFRCAALVFRVWRRMDCSPVVELVFERIVIAICYIPFRFHRR